MSFELALRVAGVGKCYQIYDLPHKRLLQMMSRGRRKFFREFWALHDVSFEVAKGETVGLIGKNGAGKSTLLQIVCGTLTPSSGIVEVSGRIGALLELGSGFNPEFTGRENVYLNGALLGFSTEEIDEKFDKIVDFSGVGDFIDQPIKTYSSGMVVRLAFSVQAQSDPDLLIVDEALAVGDAKFQAKCFSHLKDLKQRGTSILLVSHSTEQIATHCDRAIYLNDGRVAAVGKPRDVINTYLDHMFGAEKVCEDLAPVGNAEVVHLAGYDLSLTEDRFNSRKTYNPLEYRWGDGAVQILDYCLNSGKDLDTAACETGALVSLRLSIRFRAEVVRPILGFTIKTKEGVTLYNTNSELLEVDGIAQAGTAGEVIGISISFKASLFPGDYFVSVGIASRQPDGTLIPHDRRYDAIHMTIVHKEKIGFSGIFDLGAEMNSDFSEFRSTAGKRTEYC